MNKNLYLVTLLAILIAGFFLGIFFTRSCHNLPDSGNTDTSYVTRIIPGDSSLTLLSDKVPDYIDSSIYYYFDIDTPAIVAEFFKGKYYIDTIYSENNILAIIKDSINLNRLLWRNFELQNLREKAVYTTQITHSEGNIRQLSVGGAAIFDSKRVYVGPTLMFRDKHKNNYSVGIHYAHQQPVAFSVGFQKQIKIR
ncbi:MAG: hypothetical protein PHZ02_15205 [Desulfocapsaceae bacterium]|nr:hypothetical protein [Desulfocapsaceae bacterium]